MNMYLLLQNIFIHNTTSLMLSKINLNTNKEILKQIKYLIESTLEFIFKFTVTLLKLKLTMMVVEAILYILGT